MSTDPIVRANPVKATYTPFQRSEISEDWSGYSDFYGVTEAVRDIKDRIIVSYEMSGAVRWNELDPGYRAISYGMGDAKDRRWMTFITGLSGGCIPGNNWTYRPEAARVGVTPGTIWGTGGTPFNAWSGAFFAETFFEECSIRKWYEWGIRKFHLHQPWGRTTANSGNQERMAYQPDQYILARDGFTCPFTNVFSNYPMPWLTNDVIEGVTEGFVPLFRALTTGSSAGLSEDVWQRLTGIGTEFEWFDPTDPIEITCYNGSINYDNLRRWRRWFEAGTTPLPDTEGMGGAAYARKRLIDSMQPIKDAGMRIAFDAIVAAPGPIVGINATPTKDIMRNGAAVNPYANLSDIDNITISISSPAIITMPTGVVHGLKKWDAVVFSTTGQLPNGIVAGKTYYITPVNFSENTFTISENLGNSSTLVNTTNTPPQNGVHKLLRWGGIIRYVPDFETMFDGGGTFGITLDRGWWNFFSEWVIPTFGKKNIFMEAVADTIQLPPFNGSGFTANPYVMIGGINVATSDEFARGGFGGNSLSSPINAPTSQRMHYLAEYGDVEFRRSLPWSAPPHIGWISKDGVTFANGKYWYMEPVAQKGRNYSLFADGSAFGSGLFPSIGAADVALGADYLRTIWVDTFFPADHPLAGQRSGVIYPGAIFHAPIITDHLTQQQYIGNGVTSNGVTFGDMNPVYTDRTKATLQISAETRIAPTSYWYAGVHGITAKYGITHDFNRGFPTITDFAKYVADVRSGRKSLDLRKMFEPTVNYADATSNAVRGAASNIAENRRVDGIEGVMYLDVAEYDAYAKTGVAGRSGGGFYIAAESKGDLDQIKIESWLDMKLRTWYDRFGHYPKYMIWSLTPFDGTPEALLNQFQIPRQLYYPKSIPATETESPTPYRDNRENYYARVPSITFDSTTNSERLVNVGSCGIPFCGDAYTEALNILVPLLRKTKAWRNSKVLQTKIGLYDFPYLPQNPVTAYKITGNHAFPNPGTAQVVIAATAGWNDKIFPIQAPNDGAGVRQGISGYMTEAQTESMKRRIKLEFRKRLEPIAKECEIVIPAISCGTPEEIMDDSRVESRKQWYREIINLAHDMKTIVAWDVFTGVGTQPAMPSAKIIPSVTPEYGGIAELGLTFGDPLISERESFIDYPKMYYTMIDWLRDDFLRPVRGMTKKIDGLTVRSNLDRAIKSSRLNNSIYSGRTADRVWVGKWVQADGGAGATSNYSTSASPITSIIQDNLQKYFNSQRKISRNLLYRFDRGVPRVDVVKPYNLDLFAATWNPGYSGSHPSTLNGMRITDVVPSCTVGLANGGTLRPAGYSGSVDSTNMGIFLTILKKVPRGRRVLLPYYWHQDPISDQIPQIDFYRKTSDGMTYSGSIPKRAHENPADPITFASPWAYKQTADAKKSFETFLWDCAATGATFDFIADDGESWSYHGVGSNSQVCDVFGPTGMPAIKKGDHVYRWYDWLGTADNRIARSITDDARFTTLGNSFDGLSFGAAIEKYYKMIANPEISGGMPYLVGTVPDASNIIGATAGEIMAYYTYERSAALPFGISAATGPATASAYAPPETPNSLYTGVPAAAINPFRNPWNTRNDFFSMNLRQTINRYMAWLAQGIAIKNLVMGDLYKKMWIDTIDGITIEEFRGLRYNHYDITPMGITEGSKVRDGYGHNGYMGSIYPWIDPAPTLYGELDWDLFHARYYPSPQNDNQRYTIAKPNDFNLDINNSVMFSGTSKTARSYIALLRDLTHVRGFLRTYPKSWRYFAPWIKSPYLNDLYSHSYAIAQEGNSIEGTDHRYAKELVFHCCLSGARYINYFDGAVVPSASGFSGGLTFMQDCINQWKYQVGEQRVQPASNLAGNVGATVDMVDISRAGGNHVGAIGTVTSGGKILKESRGKTASAVYGAIPNETYIWRVTSAPQGVTLYKSQEAGRFLSDIPSKVVLGTPQMVPHYIRLDTNTTDEEDFYKVITSQGSVSSTDSAEGIVLKTTSGIANSGAQLRHYEGSIPTGYSDLPLLLGSGREATLTFVGKNLEQSEIDPGYGSGVPGSKASYSFVGFINSTVANGKQGSNGNIAGIERAVGFFTIGGSWWQTFVSIKKTDGTYEITHQELIVGTSPLNEHKLSVNMNKEGTKIRFFVDDVLIREVTSSQSQFPIGSLSGDGVFAGCMVRDASLSTGSGTLFPQRMLCKSMNLIIGKKDGDADVTTGELGIWVKRTVTTEMPLYQISKGIPSLPEGVLSSGSGFSTDEATNDGLFTGDPVSNNPNSDLNDVSDLRVIAAWKDDPIPFDPTPNGITVALVAYHPSGIRTVEASLNGGPIVSRTGTAGVAYGEFEFYIPPVLNPPPGQVVLPKTIAGATYFHMHQVRAKVFPFTGGTRILGGEPEQASRYYTTKDASFTTIRKINTNETSFFVQNIDTANDPGYRRVVCSLNTTSSPYSLVTIPGSGTDQGFLYSNRLRDAILHCMNTTHNSLVTATPDGRSGASFLDIELIASSDYFLPTSRDSRIVQIFDGNGNPIQDTASIAEPERKAIRITVLPYLPVSTAFIRADNVSSLSGDPDNTQSSYNNLLLADHATAWSPTAVYGKTNPTTAKAYGLTGTPQRIYRLETDPLSNYNVGATRITPTGTAGTHPLSPWSPSLTTSTNQNNLIAAARAVNCFGIGRVKIGGKNPTSGTVRKDILVHKSSMPDIGANTTSTQAWAFQGLTLSSETRIPVDPRTWARNGNISFNDCRTHSGITNNLANAFGFSRYVVGCTANGVYGTVFSNANFVRDSAAIGCTKIDKNNPSFFGRKSGKTAGSIQEKYNSIYMNTICSGDNADCVSMENNEQNPVGTRHNIEHFDILYRNLQFHGKTGIADRISGYVHNVHFDGVTTPNALVFTDDYNIALDNFGGKFHKIYTKGGLRPFMVLNEGATARNELAFAGGRRYNETFGISAFGMSAEVMPRLAGSVSYKIRGIPWRSDAWRQTPSETTTLGGNTITPLFFVTDSNGIRKFGLDMGRGFGPTASGFAQRGLTFASWANSSFTPPITPRLSMVYSCQPRWSSPPNGFGLNISGVGSRGYEARITTTVDPVESTNVNLNLGLQTFYDGFTWGQGSTAIMFPSGNNTKEWMLARNYTSASDVWAHGGNAQTGVNSQPDVFCIINDSPGSIRRHWLLEGNNTSPWSAATNSTILYGSNHPSLRGAFDVFSNTNNATIITNFLNAINTLGNGLTFEDQYGNLYFAPPGVFISANAGRIARVLGNNIRYGSGSLAGTPWTASGVIANFPREWIFNGDAENQYAPLKLDINLNNPSLYNANPDVVPDPVSFTTNPLWDQNVTPGVVAQSSVHTITGLGTGVTIRLRFFIVIASSFGTNSTLKLLNTSGGGELFSIPLDNPGQFIQTVDLANGNSIRFVLDATDNNANGFVRIINTTDNNTELFVLGLTGGFDTIPTWTTLTTPLSDPTTDATVATTNIGTIAGINGTINLIIRSNITTGFGTNSLCRMIKNGSPVLSIPLANIGTNDSIPFSFTSGDTIQFELDSRKELGANPGQGTIEIINTSNKNTIIQTIEINGGSDTVPTWTPLTTPLSDSSLDNNSVSTNIETITGIDTPINIGLDVTTIKSFGSSSKLYLMRNGATADEVDLSLVTSSSVGPISYSSGDTINLVLDSRRIAGEGTVNIINITDANSLLQSLNINGGLFDVTPAWAVFNSPLIDSDPSARSTLSNVVTIKAIDIPQGIQLRAVANITTPFGVDVLNPATLKVKKNALQVASININNIGTVSTPGIFFPVESTIQLELDSRLNTGQGTVQIVNDSDDGAVLQTIVINGGLGAE